MVTSVMAASVPHEPAKTLAHVVAGDVFHDAATRLDGFAAPGHRRDAEKMVARGARLDTARTGEIGRDGAADGALARRKAKQRAVIHRLEGELLVIFIEQGFDFGQRRTGAGGQHQFGRLIERDAGKPRQVERHVGLAGAADGALGAVPANFQRLVVAERPENGVLDLFGVAGVEDVGHSSSRATNDTIKNKVKRITPPLGRL
jgi:hypothetical protein